MSGRVLVAGGAGYFGSLVVDDLLRFSDCEVVLGARRSLGSAAFKGSARVSAVHLDLGDEDWIRRALQGVDAAICAAGPFQDLTTALLEACLDEDLHYLDLCDDRRFYRAAAELARERPGRGGVRIGWSAAPALTGVLAELCAARLDEVEEARLQIAPGNRQPRSAATVSSLLDSAGRNLDIWEEGRWVSRRGWSSPHVFRFPEPVGPRVGYLVDAPDHEVFPPMLGARTVRFRAGAELGVLNAGASIYGALSRLGLPGGRARWAGPLRAVMAATSWLGHDHGAVGAELIGRRGDRRRWVRASVVARRQGQRIAAMPAALEAARLVSGRARPGAAAPSDWIDEKTLGEECRRRDWRLILEEGAA